MREPRPITVSIDGQDVRMLVQPITVAVVSAVMALGAARGPQPQPDTLRRLRASVAALRPFLQVPVGEVVCDGAPLASAEELAAKYPARVDVLAELRDAALATARLSDEERRDLKVATRFQWWLGSASGPWKETGASCRKCIEADLCGLRGCDGTPPQSVSGRPRVVWHDAHLVVNVCPVRSLTPTVQAVWTWFDACYGILDGRFRRIALPGPGAVADQDAWLLDALAHVAHVKNELLYEHERAPADRGGDDDEGDA